MEKRSMQGIVPGERRSITRIPLPEGKLKVRREALQEVYAHDDDPEPEPVRTSSVPPPPPPRPPKRETHFSELEPKKRSRIPWKIIVSIVIGLAALAFVLTLFLGAAKIVVTPHSENVSVDVSMDADSGADADIHYETSISTKDGSKEIAAASIATTTSSGTSTGKKIETKATGKIVVYNDFSASPQTLVATTRFQTASGLIYRTPTTITIPGKKAATTAGGKDTPGSVEVTVVADKPGPAYNIGLTDFTIPGFKDSPQFKTIYARSKTEMSGGFTGAAVDQGASGFARATLREELRSSLIAEAKSQVPAGLIAYDAGTLVSYQSQPDTVEGGKTVIHEKASLTLFMFKKDEIDQKLITSARPQLASTSLDVRGDDKLQFSFSNNQATTSVTTAVSGTASSTGMAIIDQKTGPIHFNLKGQLGLTWKFDQGKLKQDLADVKKRGVDQVLARYPAIQRADVILRPFWKTSFPSDPSKITIEIVNPK